MSESKDSLFKRFVDAPHSVKLVVGGFVLVLLGGASTGFEYADFGVDPSFKYLFFGFGAVLILLSIPLARDKAKYEYMEREAIRAANLRTAPREEEVILTTGDLAVLEYLRDHGPLTEAELMSHTCEYPKRYSQDEMTGLWMVLKCRYLHKQGKVKLVGDVFSVRGGAMPDKTIFRDTTEL